MDKWTFNKIAGAVLASLLVIFGTSTAIDILYPGIEPPPPETHVAETTAGETEAAATAGATEEGKPEEKEQTIAVRLATAEPAAGEDVAKKCRACHTFDKGGANRVGPNLYGIVGRKVASHEGFAYSSALRDHGGSWTYELLDCYLANPKSCIPGNKMAFAGIKNPSQRADLIAYLRQQSDTPAPLPKSQASGDQPADREKTAADGENK